MRVLVLTHFDLIPPEGPVAAEDLRKSLWRAERDVVDALKVTGHEYRVLGVADELKPIGESIETFKPDIVFNLLEEFAGERWPRCHEVWRDGVPLDQRIVRRPGRANPSLQ